MNYLCLGANTYFTLELNELLPKTLTSLEKT